jgi:peptide/nickel transport system substrate-binding protein
MRLIVLRWLAASSLLIATLALQAETRPQYGGTLRIAMHGAPTSLDPSNNAQTDSFALRDITLLIFDTMVTADGGGIHAALATSWQSLPGNTPANTRWQFRLRHGVKFDDGTALEAETVSASLRAANPAWAVTVDGDSVTIECDGPHPQLLKELALPRYAIVKKNSAKPNGTGPFHIVDWQPGKKLTLAATEDYWQGRPFLDSIEITMGKSFQDQWTALALGQIDLTGVPAEQAHRVSLEGHRLVNSSPVELIALLFTRDARSAEENSLREALALSVDRASIRSVLLQGAGQASAGVLPNWMSGYGFVFPTDVDLTQARHLREQVHTVPTWNIGYDAGDAFARLITERIALNAKDVGLSLQPTSAATADLRLVRIPLASADAWISLTGVEVISGVPTTKNDGPLEDLYAAEQKLLATQRIIPLFHLPVSYAASTALRNWTVNADGTMSVVNSWLGNSKP